MDAVQGYSREKVLLSLIESWKKSLDNKGFGGAIFMDLDDVSNTLNHEVLIVKLWNLHLNYFIAIFQTDDIGLNSTKNSVLGQNN